MAVAQRRSDPDTERLRHSLDIERLRQAIQQRHGTRCAHVRSVPVVHSEGNVFHWEGRVEIFACVPPGKLIYAWYRPVKGGNAPVIVLGDPPIWDAAEAVRSHYRHARESKTTEMRGQGDRGDRAR